MKALFFTLSLLMISSCSSISDGTNLCEAGRCKLDRSCCNNTCGKCKGKDSCQNSSCAKCTSGKSCKVNHKKKS